MDEAGDSSWEALRRRLSWASSACSGFSMEETPPIRFIGGRKVPADGPEVAVEVAIRKSVRTSRIAAVRVAMSLLRAGRPT